MEGYTHMNVVNLSKHVLTVDELHLLSKGLNFCHTPLEPNPGELRSDPTAFIGDCNYWQDLKIRHLMPQICTQKNKIIILSMPLKATNSNPNRPTTHKDPQH